MVLADPKGRMVMCPPYPSTGVAIASKEIPTPDCQRSIPVTGVDLAVVTLPGHNSSHRWGQTHIVASWNGAVLTVTSQRLPDDADRDRSEDLPDSVACPAPAGGWRVGGLQDDSAIPLIQGAVGAGFGALAMGYPHGGPTNTDGTNPSYSMEHTEQVVVVGVTGNNAQATAAIRKVFQGNLCLVRSRTTGAEIGRQNQQILAALGSAGDWARQGVMGLDEPQNPLGTNTNQIEIVVDTPAMEKMLASIDGPPVAVNAWIKPVR